MTRPAIVIGIGNPDRGDDAVGIQVARQVAVERHNVLTLEFDDPSEALDAWEPEDTVIITDAISSGRAPGDNHVVDVLEQKLRRGRTVRPRGSDVRCRPGRGACRCRCGAHHDRCHEGRSLMCLGTIGQVAAVGPNGCAKIRAGDREITASLMAVSTPIGPGDWVLVHSGLVLERLTDQEARDALQLGEPTSEGVT